MKIKSIVFDLDGTLIDSSPGIISTIHYILKNKGLMIDKKFDSSIIGPPLRETLKIITNFSTEEIINELIDEFKRKYDSTGYKEIIVYPGINEALQFLINNGINLYIATNKRIKPTKMILEYLGWEEIFKEIYALDSVNPAYINKTAMLKEVKNHLNNKKEKMIYVGDKNEDGYAADENLIPFFKVKWGYGLLEKSEDIHVWEMIDKPEDIKLIIK
jgi:phosphoglycolate phosphatase